MTPRPTPLTPWPTPWPTLLALLLMPSFEAAYAVLHTACNAAYTVFDSPSYALSDFTQVSE